MGRIICIEIFVLLITFVMGAEMVCLEGELFILVVKRCLTRKANLLLHSFWEILFSHHISLASAQRAHKYVGCLQLGSSKESRLSYNVLL